MVHFEENGIGCRISRDEAYEVINNDIERGLVPECISGHCVAVHSVSARILRSRNAYSKVGPWPEKPEGYVGFNEYLLCDRINRGLLCDYVLTTIVE